MYDELARWWPLLSPPSEYAEEARIYDSIIRGALNGPAATMLELGSGGGNNASHLKMSWDLTLVDRAPKMIEISRTLNPNCAHHVGDMRTVRLGQTFDAVFIHDAIDYMTTLDDLARAFETAHVHLRSGGVLLVAPDDTKENYAPNTDCDGNDGTDSGMRFLEWSYDPDPTDDTSIVEYAYLLREPDGSVRVEHDRHEHGLFARQQWLDTLTQVGFRSVRGMHANHSELPPDSYELFVGVRA